MLPRRDFMKLAGTLTSATLLAGLAQPAHAAPATQQYGAADLSGWQTVLGDGVWTAPQQAPVGSADIATQHLGAASRLMSNVQRRGVMAHNITYTSRTNASALDSIHSVSYQFRLPYVPATTGGDYNAQTFEGGLFIWDGAKTLRDYGMAFQWILNPWMSTFGTIRCWASDSQSQWWAPSGYLQPDTAWHTMQLVVDPHNQSTTLTIDDVVFPSTYTKTPKPSSWGTEVAARLQTEIISLWPGNNATAPAHVAEVKNWAWNWYPYA